MELDEVIRKRRSIRSFQSKEIPKEMVEKIIEAGTYAPSAHFREPWEVIVLRRDKDKVVEEMRKYTTLHKEDKSIPKTIEVIERANLLFLIYCTSTEQFEYNLLSIGGFIENMLLKATDLGIGSVWIGNVCPMATEISSCFSIDPSKKLVSAIAFGYKEKEPKDLKRKTGKEITTYR